MQEYTKESAKKALDTIIQKARVHFYKPIQIAEILFYDRTEHRIDLLALEEYRNKSKKWRDEICKVLLGRNSTSSARYQDDLFNENAIPPKCLAILGEENRKTSGAVEAYIYRKFTQKYSQLNDALRYVAEVSVSDFELQQLLDSFRNESGLKRSLDKVYEIIVFSLFSVLVEALNVHIEMYVDTQKQNLLDYFKDFGSKVLQIDNVNISSICNAQLYRVGVTNAADRGLDMYSNWGTAIQVKHLNLDSNTYEEIIKNISSDKIIIVCKSMDKDLQKVLSTNKEIANRIQSIIVESDLVDWYRKILKGNYSRSLGTRLLKRLQEEISKEFPSVKNLPPILQSRHYEEISDSFWV